MSDIPNAVFDEIKALKSEIARDFDDKIKSLDRKADEKWDELQRTPDAVIGNGLKAILADAEAAREAKAAAMEKALTERMDEVETKARRAAFGEASDDDAIKTALDGFRINRETGRGRLVLPTKAVVVITNANANGVGFADRQPGVREYRQDPLSMRSVIMPGTMEGHFFVYERELAGSMEGDADYQSAEGAAKPTMDLYTEMVQDFTSTIAVTARTSQQVFDDRPAFISFLRNRMGYRVLRKLDGEILNGAGGDDLEGINTNAAAYNNGHVAAGVEAVQRLDVLRFARNQVEIANYVPNFAALHPTDWAGIETLKDGDERYLIGDPRTGGSTGVGRVGSVWGLPVITTAGQSAGDFTVGDGMEAQLFVRQELEVLASTEDQDNFVTNRVTLRAEMRALLAIYSELAFVTGDFSSALAAT